MTHKQKPPTETIRHAVGPNPHGGEDMAVAAQSNPLDSPPEQIPASAESPAPDPAPKKRARGTRGTRRTRQEG